MPPYKILQKRRRSSQSSTSTRSQTVSQVIQRPSNARVGSSVSRASSVDARTAASRPRRVNYSSQDASQRSASHSTSRTPIADNTARGQRDTSEGLDQDHDLLNEIVMAVNLGHRGTVGCAYYIARAEKLYFMEDVQLGGPDVVNSR